VIFDKLSHDVIGAAIEVHRELGPGLLESAYRDCLCFELLKRGIPYEKEKPVPVVYKGNVIECGFRADIIVMGELILELKAVGNLAPIHTAQLLTYLKLTGCKIGLLINFNTTKLMDGIKRVVL